MWERVIIGKILNAQGEPVVYLVQTKPGFFGPDDEMEKGEIEFHAPIREYEDIAEELSNAWGTDMWEEVLRSRGLRYQGGR